ncbi:MAG: hypothetical protein QOH18_2094, partial [Solirubrobacterales bacterium]|nr:hypothetical protein [Solirubrobacterales bacterium]
MHDLRRRGAILAMVFAVAGCGTATTPESPAVSPAIPAIATTPATPAPPSAFVWTTTPAVDTAFTGARVGPIVAGSNGIVALGSDPTTGALIAWTSPDGASWQRHWLPPATFGGGIPSKLVAAGQLGYVAVGFDVAIDSSVSSVVWTSPDGVVWSADPDPSGSFAGEVVGVASGTGAIVLTQEGGGRPVTLRVSRDGRHWSVSRPTDAAYIQGVAPLAKGFVASGGIDTTLADGSLVGRNAVWLSRDGIAWSEQRELSRSLGPDTQTWFVGAGRSYAQGSEGWTEVAADGTRAPIEPPPAGGTVAGGPAGLLSMVMPAPASPCPGASIRAGDSWVALAAAPASACPAGIDVSAQRLVPLADGWLILGQAAEGGKTFGWLLRPGPATAGAGSVGGDAAVPPASAIPDPDAVTFPRPDACPSAPIE